MRAIVNAIPNAVPDHLTNRSPMIPNTTGNAAASPKPVNPRAKAAIIPDDVVDKIMQPINATPEKNESIIGAEYFFNKMPTANLPKVKMAINKVNNPSDKDAVMFLLSMR